MQITPNAFGVVRAILFSLALFIYSNTQAELTDVYTGNNYGSVNEFIDQGGAKYAGLYSPTSVVSDNGITTYTFDPNLGPKCLNGSQFETSIRDQGSENLMIHLGGGGVCWSEKCLAFKDVGVLTHNTIAILNPNLEYNPVKDWNHIFVPYCDGSLFVGDAEFDTDSDGISDRFQYGLKNISATLDVAVNNFPNPKKILLTGSSGGGYGTILASILIRSYYPDTPIDVVNDAGVGISKPGDELFTSNMIEEWNAVDLVPKSCKDCFINGHMTPIVDWILNSDDNIRFGMMTTKSDLIIGTLYLELSPQVFEESVVSEMQWLQDRHPERFHYFLKNGTAHSFLIRESTIIPAVGIGNMGNQANGITAAEWVGYMTSGSQKWGTTESTPLDWIIPPEREEPEDVEEEAEEQKGESTNTSETTEDSAGGGGSLPSSIFLLMILFPILRKTQRGN